MAPDGGLAFARLFAKRRDELDVSVVDIATRTGRPIDVVVGWEKGSAVPDGDELVDISAALKLPMPLLEEALRRVDEHRLLLPPPEPDVGLDEDTLYDIEIVELEEESDLASHPGTTPLEPFELPGSKLISKARQSLGRRRAMARAPVANPSYLEDSEETITYRLRMIFAAAGVAVVALVLRWALGGLGSSVADLWRALADAL
ncbi:MAG: helix-turn-helix transcriptional regulator [bacterium]|nr:helix-turn-helix transcriptional regulator [bacterium]